ncbi:hypothetical protein Tsubulata_042409 [Turnera subulata]|uniref:Uncharacterized protein n=1 Tax=Turnera subulata TaxID=218843 RepID=A0A9Q0F7B2_9ROSI|nr:hypothetical protein Tsubulata_042409 [Turnera subulata]
MFTECVKERAMGGRAVMPYLLPLLPYAAMVAHNCLFTGLNYSSPTLAASINQLGPAFTFLLAVIFSSVDHTKERATICGNFPTSGDCYCGFFELHLPWRNTSCWKSREEKQIELNKAHQRQQVSSSEETPLLGSHRDV